MTQQTPESNTHQQLVTILFVIIIALTVALIITNSHKTNNAQDKSTAATESSATQETTGTPQANTKSSAITETPAPTPKVTCVDVTSYDYNWDNDVLCTNPDGSTFYTSYGGARQYGYNF